MSATDTALRVLTWATADGAGPAPTGDLRGAAELADPPAEVRSAAARLAAVTAARLRLTAPPLADPRPLTTGVVIMAAAIGARALPVAAGLLQALAPPASAYEMVARHGVTAAISRPGAEGDRYAALVAALRDESPLTGLLDMHGPAGPARCELLLDDLLRDPGGRNLVTLALAAPPDADTQSAWRGELLNAMLSEDKAWVLDVYETAMRWHADGHLQRVRAAYRRLRRPMNLTAAAPTAAWWQALARLDRTRPELLRNRSGLKDHRPGLHLYWDVWRLGGL